MSHLTKNVAMPIPPIVAPLPGPYTFDDFRTVAQMWDVIPSPYHLQTVTASGISITGNYPIDANVRLGQWCGAVSKFLVRPAATGNLELRVNFDNWVFPADIAVNAEWGLGLGLVFPPNQLISPGTSMVFATLGAKTGGGQSYVHFDVFDQSAVRTARQQTAVAFGFASGYLYLQARHRTQAALSRNFWMHEIGCVTNGGSQATPSPLPEANSYQFPQAIIGCRVYVGWAGQNSSQVGSFRITSFTVQEGFAFVI